MSEKLIKEIKQKKPTLQELKKIFKKNKITSRNEIQRLMLTYNLIKYIKKDTKYMSMKKKADENVDNAYKELSGNSFKNTMKNLKKELKLQYNETTKKRSRKNKVSKK
jgi:hypothetical protein